MQKEEKKTKDYNFFFKIGSCALGHIQLFQVAAYKNLIFLFLNMEDKLMWSVQAHLFFF